MMDKPNHTFSAEHNSVRHLPSFPMATPRRWKNKESGKEFKILPWYQPIGEESEFPYMAMFLELFPEMQSELVLNYDCYKGTVMQIGWLAENANGVWFGLTLDRPYTELFEDLGAWGAAHESARQEVVAALYEKEQGDV